MTDILTHRATLNAAIAADAWRESKHPGDQAAKRATWHDEIAGYLRRQAAKRPDRSKATW